jgi:hypothetical protein
VRFYRIEFLKPDGKTPFIFQSLGMVLTSLLPSGPQDPVNGITNPAALQIEFSCPVANYTDPISGAAWLRIWGLGLQDIGQAANLTGMTVSLYAGMARGLPLANPSQAGLIMKGIVQQGIGNWIGTEQTVEMNFRAGGFAAGSPTTPTNLPFVMPKGTPLGTAISNALKVAFPSFTQVIAVRPNLVVDHDQHGQYQSLGQLAQFVNEFAQHIIGDPNYSGITVAIEGTKITVSDGSPVPAASTFAPKPASTFENPKMIAFQDLIGQPTWVDIATVSVATVLRSDIHIADFVTLPKTPFTETTNARQSLRDQVGFSGVYYVKQINHFGHSRQPDASAWNTQFQLAAVPNPSPTAPTPGPGGLLGHI